LRLAGAPDIADVQIPRHKGDALDQEVAKLDG
jgi:hypothetical protein